MSRFQSTSRVSRVSRVSQVDHVPLRQGTIYTTTNNLYQPLKETIDHPEIIRQHQNLTPVIAQNSFVSKEFRRLNTLQLRNMGDNMYIPNAELVATNNLELVQGQRFVAVDACEKIAGPPISAQEMERIQRAGMKQSRVVYEPKQPTSVVVVDHSKVTAPAPRPEPVLSRPPPQDSYTSSSYDSYGKSNEAYKYNLFSAIDQPTNECKQFGCGKCTGCPSNECVASQNRPPTLSHF